MSKLFFILLAALLMPVVLRAQDYTSFKPDKISLEQNTVHKAQLYIVIHIPLDKEQLDVDYYDNNDAEKPGVILTYKGKQPKCPLSTTIEFGAQTIKIRLDDLTEETVNRFLNKENGISLQFKGDIHFRYGTAPNYTKYGTISKGVADQMISDSLSFPADAQTKFLTAVNNMYYYKNKVDFGVQPGKDSTSVSYTLNLDFQNIYSAPSLLKCDSAKNARGSQQFLVYYGISARLSTDSRDSLNYLKIYPLILHTSNYKGAVPYDLDIKLGHESNETFTNRRVAADASFSAIIPNLVDLTSSASARLRLKPIIGVGFKGYYDYSDRANTFMSGQAYLNGYYYIPVYDQYAIILNDETFYDFSKERNPKKQLASNYSIAVGTEVPGTAFKVMFKYENGKSDINYKDSQAVVIGLIMNLFTEKPAK